MEDLNESASDYLESLEGSVQPFSEPLKNDLQQMLSGKALKKAFQMVMVESTAIAAQVSTIDLSESKGVHLAVRAQGRAEGLQRALEIIFDCSLKSEEKENGKGN